MRKSAFWVLLLLHLFSPAFAQVFIKNDTREDVRLCVAVGQQYGNDRVIKYVKGWYSIKQGETLKATDDFLYEIDARKSGKQRQDIIYIFAKSSSSDGTYAYADFRSDKNMLPVTDKAFTFTMENYKLYDYRKECFIECRNDAKAQGMHVANVFNIPLSTFAGFRVPLAKYEKVRNKFIEDERQSQVYAVLDSIRQDSIAREAEAMAKKVADSLYHAWDSQYSAFDKIKEHKYSPSEIEECFFGEWGWGGQEADGLTLYADNSMYQHGLSYDDETPATGHWIVRDKYLYIKRTDNVIVTFEIIRSPCEKKKIVLKDSLGELITLTSK